MPPTDERGKKTRFVDSDCCCLFSSSFSSGVIYCACAWKEIKQPPVSSEKKEEKKRSEREKNFDWGYKKSGHQADIRSEADFDVSKSSNFQIDGSQETTLSSIAEP